MRKMAACHILICGMGGLGVEVAKDIILGGVKSVTVQDSKTVTYQDLSSQVRLSDILWELAKNEGHSVKLQTILH